MRREFGLLLERVYSPPNLFTKFCPHNDTDVNSAVNWKSLWKLPSLKECCFLGGDVSIKLSGLGRWSIVHLLIVMLCVWFVKSLRRQLNMFYSNVVMLEWSLALVLILGFYPNMFPLSRSWAGGRASWVYVTWLIHLLVPSLKAWVLALFGGLYGRV